MLIEFLLTFSVLQLIMLAIWVVVYRALIRSKRKLAWPLIIIHLGVYSALCLYLVLIPFLSAYKEEGFNGFGFEMLSFLLMGVFTAILIVLYLVLKVRYGSWNKL